MSAVSAENAENAVSAESAVSAEVGLPILSVLSALSVSFVSAWDQPSDSCFASDGHDGERRYIIAQKKRQISKE